MFLRWFDHPLHLNDFIYFLTQIEMKQLSNFRRYIVLSNPKAVLFCLILGFIHFNSHGQQAVLLNDFVEQAENGSSRRIIGLLTETPAALNLYKGTIQAHEDSYPQKLITDVASLALLGEQQIKYRSIKGIEIKITQSSDISQIKLDPEKLKHFPNLSYILINSEVQITNSQVDQMVNGFELGDIVLLYQVSVLL
jgi:hypothetical protein